jgi:hypothetical protein
MRYTTIKMKKPRAPASGGGTSNQELCQYIRGQSAMAFRADALGGAQIVG